MAIRPSILVFEDFATQTVTPTIPDLNALIVGAAHWIMDYFAPGTTSYADKANIQVGTYGALEASPTAALPTGSGVLVVAEPPNNAPGAVLDSDSVEIFFDQARARVAHGTGGTTSGTTPNTFTASSPDTPAFATPGVGYVLPGDRLIITDGTNVIARTVMTVVSNSVLLLTSDVTGGSYTPGAAQAWSIERQVNDVEIAVSFFTVNGNVVSLSGGVTLPIVAAGVSQGNCLVTYALVYEQYTALRQDLAELGTVEQVTDITTNIGRIDARNPLAAGVFVALQNTTSIIQYYGVLSDDLVGYTSARDAISGRSDVYAIVPLNTSTDVFAMWNTDCTELALPDDTAGRPQQFRVCIGNGTLPTTSTIIPASATGTASEVTGTAPAVNDLITLTGVANLLTGGVIPSDILNVTVTSAAGTVALGMYPVAALISSTQLQVNVSTPFAGTGTCNITAEILEADGVTVRIASAALTGVVVAAAPNLYLQLQDPSGTYVSSGVAAGDILQFPADPDATITTSSVFTNLIVASVLSNQRLLIVNNGQDSSTTQNELPHGAKRIGGALVTQGALNYQVVRNLSKDQQVTDLVAVAQSFNSSRQILVWPDLCDVAGVTNGTKQPGYYLACAAGGMTAGMPSQQGFTNIGIAGIAQIYDSNTYFTDTQLTSLSDGGWFVYAQATPAALPYAIHQLTTDPATLESGEYSIVKNFDFVSIFFTDILQDFLGSYNITPETLLLLQAALNTGAQLLLLRTVAKIGAPLLSFSITTLEVSPTSADRVLIYCAIGLPNPLNVIELHLVA
jgi:hypothetical protein